jgi:hypothetical protein
MHICEKCEKSFKSKQGLIRHKSRKISCDIPVNLDCPRCKKTFKTKQNLDKHLVKKNICQIISYQKDFDKEVLLMEIKHRNVLEKIAAQKNKEIEIEMLKLQRKEKTPQVINNIINDNRIQQINNFHVPMNSKNVLDFSEETRKQAIQHFYTSTNIEDAVDMVYPPYINSSLPSRIINKLHGTEAHPKYRNVWYNVELDSFYVIEKEGWKVVNKTDIIESQIRNSLSDSLEFLKKSVKNYRSNDDMYYTNWALFNGFIQKEKPDGYYLDKTKDALNYTEDTLYLLELQN